MNGKERAALRKMANTIEPVIYIGKEGITERTLKEVYDALEARELIKGSVQQGSPVDAKTALQELCGKTGAEPIQFIGRKFVMYRPSREHSHINPDAVRE